MHATAHSPYVKPSIPKARQYASMVLLALPMLGMGTFFWVVGHRVTKPDISIFDAVDAGDYKAVHDHIATGTSPSSVGVDGHSALYRAISGRKPKIVRLLLDSGAEVDAEGRDMITPVSVAASEGDLPLVKELVAKGARLNAVTRSGDTVLHQAAASGNAELVRYLLDQGLRPNGMNHAGRTPISNAALANSLPTVDLLLQRGAVVDAPGEIGRTALHHAASRGNLPVVERLLQAGANPDKHDRYGVLPLAIALLRPGDESVARLLLEKTHDIQSTDFRRGNLLHYAVQGGVSPELLRSLLSHGIDPNRADYTGETPLTACDKWNRPELKKVLIEGGARVPLRYLIRGALNNAQPANTFGSRQAE